MSIKKLNPYLIFNGTASQAIERYVSALGASVEAFMRFGDTPGACSTPEDGNRVMHALLRFGADAIMISDTAPGMPHTTGNSAYVCVDFDDVEDMNRRFEALAAGGQITMPLQETFWGARYGQLVDAWGVPWMFNCDLKKGQGADGAG